MSRSRRSANRNSAESQRKAVVSVSEMARLCGLSRARFYDLLDDGFFPKPKRTPKTDRPYYDREGQDACLGVRGTNLGVNGQTILFYSTRSQRSEECDSKASARSRRSGGGSSTNSRMVALVDGLKQLGLDSVTEGTVQTAIRATYPEGIAALDHAAILPTLFRFIRSQRATN